MKNIVIEQNSIGHIIGASPKKFPKVYAHLKERSSLSALDLGCRVPINLFNLYHLFDFTNLVGVDIDTEEKCVKSYVKQHYPPPKSIIAESFYDVYLFIYKWEEEEKSKIESKKEFDSIFLRRFVKQDAKKFLQQNEEKFDVIIASNILHFFQKGDIDLMLSQIKSSLNEKGIVYFRVQDEKAIYNLNDFKILVQNHFQGGIFTDIIYDGKLHSTEYINFEYL